MSDNTLEKRMDEIEDRLEKIEGGNTQILALLAGNTLDKTDSGMVGQLATLKERVRKLEQWKERAVYTAIGLSAAAGWGLSDIITKIFQAK